MLEAGLQHGPFSRVLLDILEYHRALAYVMGHGTHLHFGNERVYTYSWDICPFKSQRRFC